MTAMVVSIKRATNSNGGLDWTKFVNKTGQKVAEYSGRMLHQRIAQDNAFANEDYKAALKNGYLGLDIDIRNGKCGTNEPDWWRFVLIIVTFTINVDPEYVNETSGCTAVSALITEDMRLFVVSI